jgi:hypothetical protein
LRSEENATVRKQASQGKSGEMRKTCGEKRRTASHARRSMRDETAENKRGEERHGSS